MTQPKRYYGCIIISESLTVNRSRYLSSVTQPEPRSVALLTADNEYLKKVGGDRSWISAFAGLSGPYDFVPDEPEYQNMFGPPERYPLMQLHNYIDGKQPPFLMAWGTADKTVGKINIDHVVSAMQARGGDYQVKLYDDVDHIDIVASLAILARGRAPVIDDVDAFFKSHGK